MCFFAMKNPNFVLLSRQCFTIRGFIKCHLFIHFTFFIFQPTVTVTIRFTMTETYPDASPLIEIMENTDNLTEEKSEELFARLEEEVQI